MKKQTSKTAPVARATDQPGDTSPFALGLLLRRAHDRAASALVQALRPHGLELRHFAVMILLSDHTSLSQRELAEATGSDKTAITRTVDDLEHAGLVQRSPVPGDRRVNAIALTGKGFEVFDAAHVGAAGIARDLVEHLHPGEAETLLSLLARFTYPADPDGQGR